MASAGQFSFFYDIITLIFYRFKAFTQNQKGSELH